MSDPVTKERGEQWARDQREKLSRLTTEKIDQLNKIFDDHIKWFQDHDNVRKLIETRRPFTRTPKWSATRAQAQNSDEIKAKSTSPPNTTMNETSTPSPLPPSPSATTPEDSVLPRKRSIEYLDEDEEQVSQKIRLDQNGSRAEQDNTQSSKDNEQQAIDESDKFANSTSKSPELKAVHVDDKNQEKTESGSPQSSNQRKRKMKYYEEEDDDDMEDDYDDDQVQLVQPSKHSIDQPIEQPLSTSSELSRIYNLTRNLSPNRSFRSYHYNVPSSPTLSRISGSSTHDILPNDLKSTRDAEKKSPIIQRGDQPPLPPLQSDEENEKQDGNIDDDTREDSMNIQADSENVSKQDEPSNVRTSRPRNTQDRSTNAENMNNEKTNGGARPPSPAISETDAELLTGDIPSWASSPELQEHLTRQATMDPYKIFGRITPLHLTEVFGKRSLRR